MQGLDEIRRMNREAVEEDRRKEQLLEGEVNRLLEATNKNIEEYGFKVSSYRVDGGILTLTIERYRV